MEESADCHCGHNMLHNIYKLIRSGMYLSQNGAVCEQVTFGDFWYCFYSDDRNVDTETQLSESTSDNLLAIEIYSEIYVSNIENILKIKICAPYIF